VEIGKTCDVRWTTNAWTERAGGGSIGVTLRYKHCEALANTAKGYIAATVVAVYVGVGVKYWSRLKPGPARPSKTRPPQINYQPGPAGLRSTAKAQKPKIRPGPVSRAEVTGRLSLPDATSAHAREMVGNLGPQ